MNPDLILGLNLIPFLIFAVLVGLVIRDCVAQSRRERERRDAPAPWYAFQKGGPGQRWTPEAWRDAADLSIQNSQRRRYGNPPGHPADYHG